MNAVDRPEQGKVVVAVVGGHRLELCREGLHTTLGQQERANASPQVLVVALDVGVVQDLPEQAQQPFLDPLIVGLDLVQALDGLGLGPAHAPDEHLHQLVAGIGLRLMEQAQQQGVPPAGEADIAQVAALHGGGLGGELADLGVGQPGQERPWVQEGIEIGQPLDPLAQVRERRRPRGTLQSGEWIQAGTVRPREQGVEEAALVLVQGGIDPGVEPFVDLLAQITDQAVQRREGRNLHLVLDQGLDRGADQVGGVAHGLRRPVDGGGDDGAASVRKGTAAQPLPQGGAVAMDRRRTVDLVDHWRCWRQAQILRHMCPNPLGDFDQDGEVAQPLPGLEQKGQRQSAGVPAGLAPHEQALRVA